VTYAGPSLIDGNTYYLRVKVSNVAFWSPWQTIQIRMNSTPIPTQLSPENLEEVSVSEIILTHDNPVDAEGDAVTYDYEIYDDDQMTTLITSVSENPSGAETTTSWTVPVSLVVGDDYYWRVRPDDGYENGPWSPLASFMVVPAYVCGDANGDDQANVGDAVFLISYVFNGGPAPEPIDAGNANCDEGVNVADAVYLINYVFNGGAEPCEACP
jgi:hypothetical protein